MIVLTHAMKNTSMRMNSSIPCTALRGLLKVSPWCATSMGRLVIRTPMGAILAPATGMNRLLRPPAKSTMERHQQFHPLSLRLLLHKLRLMLLPTTFPCCRFVLRSSNCRLRSEGSPLLRGGKLRFMLFSTLLASTSWASSTESICHKFRPSTLSVDSFSTFDVLDHHHTVTMLSHPAASAAAFTLLDPNNLAHANILF